MQKFSPSEITRDLDKIVLFFRRHRLSYMLIGAMAMCIWGRPRTTLDLDFLISVDDKGLEKIKNWSAQEGLRIDDDWLDQNPLLAKTHLRFYFDQVMVDLLTPRDAHDRKAFLRKKRKRLGKKFYWFVSPEDFILQKLKVGRPRDFEDAVTVLERFRKELDMVYLKRWSRHLGIMNELNYIFTL